MFRVLRQAFERKFVGGRALGRPTVRTTMTFFYLATACHYHPFKHLKQGCQAGAVRFLHHRPALAVLVQATVLGRRKSGGHHDKK